VVSNNTRNTLNNIAMDEGHSALAEVTARMSTDSRDTQAIEGGSRRAAGVTAAASASVATATPTAAAAAASSPSSSDVSAAAVVVAAVSSVVTATSTLSSPTKKRKTDDTFAMFTSPEAAGRGRASASPSAAVSDGDGASQPSSDKRGRTAKQQAFDPNRSNFGGFGDYMAHKNAGVRQRQAVTAPARESDIFAGVVVHVNGDTRPLSKVRSCATHCTTDDRNHL